MKYVSSVAVISGVFFFMLAPCLCAQDAPALPRVDEFQQKALEYIKEKRPELKPENLVFSSVDYSYQPQPTTHKVIDAQGAEHWVPDSPFTQRLNVTFLDRSTRTEKVEAGQRVAVSQTINVQFNQALTACVYVGNGTNTEYLH